MEERLREIEQRLKRLEEAASQSRVPALSGDEAVISLATPLRLVNAAGAAVLELSAGADGGMIRINSAAGKSVIELSADVDGGLVCINNAAGDFRVVLGNGPHGGWIDVIHASSNQLGLTLYTVEEGGTIEYTESGASYTLIGERYWPPDSDTA